MDQSQLEWAAVLENQLDAFCQKAKALGSFEMYQLEGHTPNARWKLERAQKRGIISESFPGRFEPAYKYIEVENYEELIKYSEEIDGYIEPD